MSADPTERPEIGVVASAGLPTAFVAPAAPVPDEHWPSFLTDVRRRKLTGLLAGAVADGLWPVTTEQRAGLSEAHGEQLAWVLHLERTALRVHEAFDDARIDHRMLKGSALAHLDYPDPSDRCFADIDILVRSEQFRAASAVLTDMGGERRFPEVRPGFDEAFVKGACHRLPGGHELDLHRTLVLGWFGLSMVPEDCFSDGAALVIGGTELTALSDAQRLMHAAIHALLGEADAEWMPLRDLAQLVLAADDPGPVLAVARRWRCEIVLAEAVQVVWDRMRLLPDHDLLRWAREYPSDRREIARLGNYRGAGRSHARLAMTAVTALPWRARHSYLAGLAFPDAGPGRLPTKVRMRHGVQAIRRLAGR